MAVPQRDGQVEADVEQTCNEVVLVGRMAAAAQERTLPSGDVLVAWRLIIDSPPPPPAPSGARSPTVDTLDCVAWAAGIRRTVHGYRPGDVVRVEGALRRRFWRAGPGAASRCEVEVLRTKRVARA